MIEKIFKTSCGNIHYYINDFIKDRLTLVMLPGLSADHRLFDKQVEYFKDKYNVFVWDGPAHNLSRPFEFNFDLFDIATWLKEILDSEGITKYVIVGQSFGGYVGQVFLEKYKGLMSGFVSIDSAPLQRKYITAIEIWLLERMEPIYKLYPWKTLMKEGSKGVAVSEYGIKLMYEMMDTYSNDSAYYCKLVGHGYKLLADAYKKDLAYKIDCPTILICGDKDRAGNTKNYNKRWAKETGLPLHMTHDAGHNSNSDKPLEINKIIEDFINKI